MYAVTAFFLHFLTHVRVHGACYCWRRLPVALLVPQAIHGYNSVIAMVTTQHGRNAQEFAPALAGTVSKLQVCFARTSYLTQHTWRWHSHLHSALRMNIPLCEVTPSSVSLFGRVNLAAQPEGAEACRVGLATLIKHQFVTTLAATLTMAPTPCLSHTV